MSHRSAQHRRHPPSAGSAGHAAVAVAIPRTDYTFAHAGHQLRLGPIAFWIVVGTLVIMASWTIITATYFAFRDDVLTRLITRQAEMQFAYEDRIAEMRAQVDRVTSRQLLDQEQFEQKLDHVLRRQAILESRAAVLGGVSDPTATGSVRGHSQAPASANARQGPVRPKPSPISDTIRFLAPIEREARLESRPLPSAEGRVVASAKAGGVEGTLARLQTSLDRVESAQAASLNAMEEHYDTRARRMRGVLADLVVDVGKSSTAQGVGGPFVSVKPSVGSSFERQLYRIKLARAQIDRLSQTLVTVPVRKPLAGEIEPTSGFGIRMDPFLGVPAMHTGQDIRAASGDPVFATAAGVVTIAGWHGGYGRLIEVRHGNGIATRYGHLSQILVSVGQKISIGQTIGRVGSTGRSTGPHLHYETRIDGEAVNPLKFLRAGVRLGALR
jgi:hypothetical protein